MINSKSATLKSCFYISIIINIIQLFNERLVREKRFRLTAFYTDKGIGR